MHGRRQPYTERGIKRVPCVRCGKPSHHQWNACSLGKRWFALCVECDIGLNRAALQYMQIPDAAAIIEAYAQTKAGGKTEASPPAPNKLGLKARQPGI